MHICGRQTKLKQYKSNKDDITSYINLGNGYVTTWAISITLRNFFHCPSMFDLKDMNKRVSLVMLWLNTVSLIPCFLEALASLGQALSVTHSVCLFV